MARPKLHSSPAERVAQFRKSKARFDFVTAPEIGETIEALAVQYAIGKNEVVNALVRYALTNRNWKTQGLVWARASGD